jgi:hypothetical protein
MDPRSERASAEAAVRGAPVAARTGQAGFARAAGLAVLVAAFAWLAILNSGGYRFGGSDQAFYVPAIMRQIDPQLFPRDRLVLAAQGDLMVVDELIAGVSRAARIELPPLLFAAYLVTLAALAAAGYFFGRELLDTRAGAVALVLAMSIRHRIPKTGVNTLEYVFQPRLLAFAVGLVALAALLRGRTWFAIALAGAAGVLHPTTGLWFLIAAVAGGVVGDRAARARLLALGACALAVVAAVAASGALDDRLVIMDADWLATLGTKDYLFPTEWAPGTWLTHLIYLAVIAVTFHVRRRAGVTRRGEAALVAGLGALVLLVLLALPFIHARVALAVQLQVTRALWLLDTTAVAYAVWWIVEAPARRRPAWARARIPAVALVAVLALARGIFVMYVERAGHPVVQVSLPENDWQRAMAWLAAQPRGAHVLTHPGHAWLFGSSVRVAAARDVYLEETKDAALAMYSREVAMRVLERTRDIGNYDRLTADRARELAQRYGLDFLVTETPFDLPLAYTNGRFKIYRLRGGA